MKALNWEKLEKKLQVPHCGMMGRMVGETYQNCEGLTAKNDRKSKTT